MTTEINAKTACERDNQIRDLTEVELSRITGGSDTSGAGKVALTEFSITRKIDKATPVLF
jgi:type VI protein secretion system component Hcp